LSSRASAAVDGDPSTAYQTPLNVTAGNWIQYTYPDPVTIDGLDMTFLTDGKHSVPTRVSVSADGGPGVPVELAPTDLGEGNERGATTEVRAETGNLTGTAFRVTFDQVNDAASKEWFGGTRTVLPIGVAEVGLPTVTPRPSSAPFEGQCRDDLVDIGGEPVPMRLVGTIGQAESSRALRLEACDGAVDIPDGRTLLESGRGTETGLDVELLTLASAAGGGAGVDTLATAPDDGPAPPATVGERTARLTWQAQVTDAVEPYWVVLAQSYGPGWTAETSDGSSLGAPTLVNGFANGWMVDPAEYGADVTITMTWAPQKWVWTGLAASSLGVLLCIGLIIGRPRRGRKRSSDVSTAVEGMVPVGVSPFESDGPPIGPARVAALSTVIAVLAVVFGGPLVGIGVGAVAVVALSVRRGQAVVRIASVGLFGAAAAFIVAKQARNGYQVDFNWMERFEVTHAWALAATMLLLVAVVVDAVRAGPSTPPTSDPDV